LTLPHGANSSENETQNRLTSFNCAINRSKPQGATKILYLENPNKFSEHASEKPKKIKKINNNNKSCESKAANYLLRLYNLWAGGQRQRPGEQQKQNQKDYKNE